MAASFPDFLADRRAEIDERLSASLAPRPGLPAELLDAMRYSVLAPGKRLRPLLVTLGAQAAGKLDDGVWPAACAVEFIHVYSLVHDDLPAMDDDDLRRGLPTCHKKFTEATAILAGDALLTLAFEALAESYPPSTAAACCADLARAVGCAGMVGGQMDDLAWERTPHAAGRTLVELEGIHLRKTGALIRACLRLGARVGTAPDAPSADVLDRLDVYGRCLGLAFQITDDLLDVTGSAGATGKGVNKDAARGKLTYPGLLGVEESRRRAEGLGREAVACVEPLGTAGARLRELVEFVLTRDR